MEEAKPQWMARPSMPGLWVCKGARKSQFPYIALELTQDDIDRGAPFRSDYVYGPVPYVKHIKELEPKPEETGK